MALSPSIKKLLYKTAEQTLSHLKKVPGTLSINIVKTTTIKRLNSRFRKRNRVTDVLSFTQLENLYPSGEAEIGDVIICLSRAKEQAKEYGYLLNVELARLLIHGTLHLFGYDHEKTKAEAKKMFSLQEKILRSIIRG